MPDALTDAWQVAVYTLNAHWLGLPMYGTAESDEGEDPKEVRKLATTAGAAGEQCKRAQAENKADVEEKRVHSSSLRFFFSRSRTSFLRAFTSA